MSPQQEPMPFIVDRADGVIGHYAIRKIVDGTAWHWNEESKPKWSAFGSVYIGLEAASAKLIEVAALNRANDGDREQAPAATQKEAGGATAEQGYRMLEVGEAIQEGDEFSWDSKSWFETGMDPGQTIPASDTGIKYRRPSPTPQAEPPQGTATPRTDAMEATLGVFKMAASEAVDFARTLERELAEARQECERLTKELDTAKLCNSNAIARLDQERRSREFYFTERDSLRQQLAAVTAERDEARVKIKLASETLTECLKAYTAPVQRIQLQNIIKTLNSHEPIH